MSTTEARSAVAVRGPTPGSEQPLDDGIVFAEARELALDVLAALLKGVDLCE